QRIQTGVDRHDDAQKSVDCFEFLANQAQRDVIKTSAAILFGNANAQQVQLAHLPQHFRVKLLRLVPLLDEGSNLLLRKLAHGLHQSLVIFRQLEINHWYLSLEIEAQNDR